MVGQKLLGGGVHHGDLGPVAATAAYGVGCVLSVLRLECAGEGHCAVVAQGVGVEEHLAVARLEVGGAVYHGLVLKAVVLGIVIFAVIFAGGDTTLHKIVEVGQTLGDGSAIGNLREILLCHLVLGLDPSEGLGSGVVLQRAVDVTDLQSEDCVDSPVLRCGRVIEFLGSVATCHRACQHGCSNNVKRFHFLVYQIGFILVFTMQSNE